jgi:protoheme IX farnesyltransferase
MWSCTLYGLKDAQPGQLSGVGLLAECRGITLSLAVLFWIPTHIQTFNLRNYKDYQAAGIPTFPAKYGVQFTQLTIAISSVIAAFMMGIAAYGIGLTWGYLRLMAVLTGGLLFLAMASILKPSDQVNFGLFKYASLYMLSAMVLLATEAF